MTSEARVAGQGVDVGDLEVAPAADGRGQVEAVLGVEFGLLLPGCVGVRHGILGLGGRRPERIGVFCRVTW